MKAIRWQMSRERLDNFEGKFQKCKVFLIWWQIIIIDKMIKSQKDQGNQLFKNGKYSQAIKHYKVYVQQPHQDNKNAYFNLSLCYSKLGKRRESIEAAEKAVSLDPNYTKCYYRLALENKEVENRDYEVFINAYIFLRLASKQQVSQRQQMKKIQAYYKNKLSEIKKDQKINNLDQIISLTQGLITQNQLRIEVDKEINEWLTQWSQNTQDEEAKLLEIRYIMEEIDYDYGLNVAYFYLNQITNQQQKARVLNQINLIKTQLNRQKPIQIKNYQVEEQFRQIGQFDKKQQSSDDDQNLFETDEKVQEKRQPKVLQTHAQHNQNNISSQQKVNLQKLKQQQKKQVTVSIQTCKTNNQAKSVPSSTTQTEAQNILKLSTTKTPKQRIQQLLRNKQKILENFGQTQARIDRKDSKQNKKQRQTQNVNQPKVAQKQNKKQKIQQKYNNYHSCDCSHQHDNHSHEPLSEAQALQRRKNIVQQIKSAFPSQPEDKSSKNQSKVLPKKYEKSPPKKEQIQIAKREQKKSNKLEQKKLAGLQIQELYNSYCGWLANEKNKFADTYRCVLQILESTNISSIVKGELLVLLKKRVKNFIIIMRSNSENEQKVLYSLLTKHGIQQYANEITPLLYTP